MQACPPQAPGMSKAENTAQPGSHGQPGAGLLFLREEEFRIAQDQIVLRASAT